MKFFRHCPGCGSRFHIKLEEKKMVHLEREMYRREVTRSPGPGPSGPTAVSRLVLVSEGSPVTLDIEDFEYRYRCGHCSHEWTEHVQEKHKER